MLSALFAAVLSLFQSRAALQLEILALRHQLGVLQRSVKKPKLNRFDRMLWGAGGIGAGTAAVGIYLSFVFNAASGATIVLTEAAVFGLVFLLTWRHRRSRPSSREPEHEHLHEHVGRLHLHPHPHGPEGTSHGHTHPHRAPR